MYLYAFPVTCPLELFTQSLYIWNHYGNVPVVVVVVVGPIVIVVVVMLTVCCTEFIVVVVPACKVELKLVESSCRKIQAY